MPTSAADNRCKTYCQAITISHQSAQGLSNIPISTWCFSVQNVVRRYKRLRGGVKYNTAHNSLAPTGLEPFANRYQQQLRQQFPALIFSDCIYNYIYIYTHTFNLLALGGGARERMCYRKNVKLPSLEIHSPGKSQLFHGFQVLYVMSQRDICKRVSFSVYIARFQINPLNPQTVNMDIQVAFPKIRSFESFRFLTSNPSVFRQKRLFSGLWISRRSSWLTNPRTKPIAANTSHLSMLGRPIKFLNKDCPKAQKCWTFDAVYSARSTSQSHSTLTWTQARSHCDTSIPFGTNVEFRL